MLQSLLRECYGQLIGQTVQLLLSDATRCRHAIDHNGPHLIDKFLHLLAVGVRHLREEVRLNSTLILTSRRTQDIDLNTQLINQTLIKYSIHLQARPIERALGLHIDFIGHRCEVVTALRVGVVVGHNPLAALLKGCDGGTQLLQQSHTCRATARKVDIYTLDALILCCALQCTQSVVDSKRRYRRH